MIVLRGHPFEWEVHSPTAVTVGVFDGVHLGHRQVLHAVAAHSPELTPTVVTFQQHPLSILAPDRAPLMLGDLDQRLEQFRALGIDVTGVLNFPEIRNLPSRDFCDHVLAGSLQAKLVVIGADFRFGRDREGDIAALRASGDRFGFEVEVLEMVASRDGVISSTRIRQLLGEGQVAEAARLLGRPYQLKGVVVEGDRRGRQLGFPTANLGTEPYLLWPANGVYAARSHLPEVSVPAVVNIGVRPTFAGAQRRLEAHLIDFEANLYGRTILVDFVARIRGEQRFDSGESLAAQIAQDVEAARRILAAD